MSLKSQFRKQAGALRDKMLYGRDNARIAARAAEMRATWIDAAVAELPPLPAPDAPDFEVHTMCGEAQAHMGLWSSWSLMRFLPTARFVVHDDGSLAPETIASWRRLLPGIRIIARKDAETAMQSHLAETPRLIEWSRAYHFGLKLGGVQAMAQTPRIAEMDTDVLCLSDPVAFRARAADPACRMTWNVDSQYAYPYPLPLLEEVAGLAPGSLPDRLNSGFTMLEPFTAEERVLLSEVLARMEADPRIDPLRYWMQQALHACIAASRGQAAQPLPDDYTVYSGPTRPDSAVRHYVGNPRTRPRFFCEGVPSVLRDAVARGHAPETLLRHLD